MTPIVKYQIRDTKRAAHTQALSSARVFAPEPLHTAHERGARKSVPRLGVESPG